MKPQGASVKDLVKQVKKPIPNRRLNLRQGTVSAVNAGPPASVDVKIGADTVATPGIRYLASYTPTVNDVVFLIEATPDYVVLGKLA